MMYFLRGSLPWQNLKAKNKNEKYERIMEKKLSTSIEVLCKGFPPEFATYLSYTRNLRFDEKPDYAYLRNLLKELFVKSNFELDYVYDWNLLGDLDKAKNESKDLATGNSTNLAGTSNIATGASQSKKEEEKKEDKKK
jgi:hypothetical protein